MSTIPETRQFARPAAWAVSPLEETVEDRDRSSLPRYSALTVEPTLKPVLSATSRPMRTSPSPGQRPSISQWPLRARTASTSIPPTR